MGSNAEERRARVVTLLDDDPFAASLGVRLVDVTASTVTVEMTVVPTMLNFVGSAHGGAVFSLADCAFSLASNAPGRTAVAIDTHLALTAASAAGDVLVAAAEEMYVGRRLATSRVTVQRADGRLVGLFTGTVYRME